MLQYCTGTVGYLQDTVRRWFLLVPAASYPTSLLLLLDLVVQLKITEYSVLRTP
jgi:hypothetical protein